VAFDVGRGVLLIPSGIVGLRNMIAGVICATVSLVFSLSYATLIFSGPLVPWLGYGITATFMTAAIGGVVMALRSSLPFALASPDASTTAIMAALVSTLVSRLVAESAGDQLLAPTLIMLSLASGLTGLMLCGLGVSRAGRAVRFIPYPVIGGFLGASGWLITAGAIQVMTGYQFRLAGIRNFLNILTLAQVAAGISVTVVLLVCRTRFKGPLAQPVQLLACAAVLYAGLMLFGVSIGQAQADGWMFQPPSAATFAPPWNLADWQNFPWHLLPVLGGDLIAVMFVAAVSILLNVAGLEVTAKHEADFDRELTTAGISNIAAAAVGGYVNGVPLSRSTLAFKLAGNSRLPSLCVAASSLLMLGVNPEFLAYVPKCVLGGLLLTLGLDLLYRWLVASSRQLSPMEYLSLVAITLMIINWGFIAGILVGIIIGCTTFALSASRVSVIKFSFDGSEYRSSLDRGRDELELLAKHGHELHGMSLQSYLFFGSANQLYQHIKDLLVARPECRHLLFDFRLVTGMDSSATHSFTQIKQAADKSGAKLVLINVSPAVTNAFRAIGFLSKDIIVAPDLDHALESCENAIIARHQKEDSARLSLREWLTEALGSLEYADALAQRCRRLDYSPGGIVARQGEPSNSMHFILEGRIGVVVDLGNGRTVRVRSLGQHTTVGEMGLITRSPRSATIEAEVPSVVYEFAQQDYERMKIEKPDLIQALLTYVIRVMAERLSFASRFIGVLQR